MYSISDVKLLKSVCYKEMKRFERKATNFYWNQCTHIL